MATRSMKSDTAQPDPKTLAKDALFEALRVAMPNATHDQLLRIIRALDRYVSVAIYDHEAL